MFTSSFLKMSSSSARDDLAWARVVAAFPQHGYNKDGVFGCRHNQLGSSNECYGEPELEGYPILINSWPPACALDAQSVFYDVGSGHGRLAAYIRLHTNVSAVRGIEINVCRHSRAIELQSLLTREIPQRAHTMSFVNGDVRALGFADATHIFLSSQCWDEALMRDVLAHATKRAPRLRCAVLFSWRRPDHWTADLRRMADAWGHVVGVHSVPTTWSGASAVFLRRGACLQRETWREDGREDRGEGPRDSSNRSAHRPRNSAFSHTSTRGAGPDDVTPRCVGMEYAEREMMRESGRLRNATRTRYGPTRRAELAKERGAMTRRRQERVQGISMVLAVAVAVYLVALVVFWRRFICESCNDLGGS